MVDDQIRDQIYILPQRLNISPTAQARIDLSVVDGIEASIGAVNRVIKWEEMDTTKQSSQWSFEQFM